MDLSCLGGRPAKTTDAEESVVSSSTSVDSSFFSPFLSPSLVYSFSILLLSPFLSLSLLLSPSHFYVFLSLFFLLFLSSFSLILSHSRCPPFPLFFRLAKRCGGRLLSVSRRNMAELCIRKRMHALTCAWACSDFNNNELGQCMSLKETNRKGRKGNCKKEKTQWDLTSVQGINAMQATLQGEAGR